MVGKWHACELAEAGFLVLRELHPLLCCVMGEEIPADVRVVPPADLCGEEFLRNGHTVVEIELQ